MHGLTMFYHENKQDFATTKIAKQVIKTLCDQDIFIYFFFVGATVPTLPTWNACWLRQHK